MEKISLFFSIKHFIYLTILLLLKITTISSNAEFNQLITTTEKYLKETSKEIQNIYNKKCSIIKEGKCFNTSCLKSSCSNEYKNSTSYINSNTKCVSDFKFSSEISKDLSNTSADANKACNYMNLNIKSSSVKLADKYFPLVDEESPEVKEDICYSYALDAYFPELYFKNSTSEEDYGVNIAKWQYFGTQSGVLRVYPGIFSCKTYDHRRMEWYDRAIRKPLNVILAVDFSGGINNAGKKQLLIKTVQSIIENIDNSMWIGLIPMMKEANVEDSSSASKYPYLENIVKADQENKEKVLNRIKEASFLGEYSYDENKINNYINKFNSNNIGVNCSKPGSESSTENSNSINLSDTVVIHIVGSSNIIQPSSNSTVSTSEVNTVKNHNYNSIYLSIDSKDNSFFINKQCVNSNSIKKEDLYYEVNSPSDLDNIIEKFIDYTSLGVVRDNIIWKKYNDYFGLGEVLTASIPVYSSTNELLGVYGIDYKMNEISSFFPEYETDLEYYIERNGQCTTNNKVSLCSIERLRLKKCYGDSKSFENQCSEEKLKLSKKLCTLNDVKNSTVTTNTTNDINKRFLEVDNNLLITNVFKDKKFYCDDDLYSEYKFFNNENIDKSCCLANEELNNKLLYKVIAANKQIISSSTDKSNTASSQVSTQIDSENVDHLVTPLEDSSKSNNTTKTNTENTETTEDKVINDKEKENENTPKPENKSLYIVIILIVAVMIFVIWHLRKNQPRSYTNNTELSQSMNQSSRSNFYS